MLWVVLFRQLFVEIVLTFIVASGHTVYLPTYVCPPHIEEELLIDWQQAEVNDHR